MLQRSHRATLETRAVLGGQATASGRTPAPGQRQSHKAQDSPGARGRFSPHTASCLRAELPGRPLLLSQSSALQTGLRCCHPHHCSLPRGPGLSPHQGPSSFHQCPPTLEMTKRTTIPTCPPGLFMFPPQSPRSNHPLLAPLQYLVSFLSVFSEFCVSSSKHSSMSCSHLSLPLPCKEAAHPSPDPMFSRSWGAQGPCRSTSTAACGLQAVSQPPHPSPVLETHRGRPGQAAPPISDQPHRPFGTHPK